MYLIIPAALGPGVHLTSNRDECQKQKNNISGSEVWPVHRVDNFATIFEPVVYTMWDS
jgi:hypothetical protein